MLIMARANPRDPVAATDEILNAFTRASLAEQAKYQYARGGNDIDGPSIRAAESIAQLWGNIEFGFKEISRGIGADNIPFSEVEAYAWDLQKGARRPVQFIARHWRDTKSGGYVLKDERDIYELVANMAQRRVRACILAIVPGDVIEAAMKQAETTLRAKADTSPEAMQKMIEAFSTFGVTKDQIEKRIQRRIDAITPAQVVTLKKIYASLRDGMSEAADWFETAEARTEGAAKPELPPYPPDQFKKNLTAWRKLIADGKKTVEQVIAMAQTRNTLTDEQKAAIAEAPPPAEKAAPAVIEGIRAKAKEAALTDAEVAKHLGIASLDELTVPQAERALAFIKDPMGAQQ